MTSKFVEAPGFVNQIEAGFAAYGVSADISELGIAVTVGVFAMGVLRSFLWTA